MDHPDPDVVLRGSDGAITSLVYARLQAEDETQKVNILLSGSDTGFIYTWDLRTCRIAHSITGSGSSILSIGMIESNRVVSQCRDGVLQTWNIDGKTSWYKIDSIRCASLGFCRAAIGKLQGSFIIAVPCGKPSQVEVIDINTKEIIATLQPRDSQLAVGMPMDIKIYSAADDHQTYVVVGYEDGSIILWDLRMPGFEVSRTKLHNDTVMAFDVCSQTGCGLSGSVDTKLSLWHVDKHHGVSRTVSVEIPTPGIACVQARTDGKLFAVGGWDSRVRLFSGRKATPLVTLAAHRGTIQSLAFNADNSFAAGSKDKTISIWSVYKNN